MLAPHELKSKGFTKKINGYNPAEVDDYIEFLIEKYTELYRENSELERKLKIVVTNFDEIRDEEEAIRSTLLKSQKLGEKIIRDANERAEVITSSIKERCDTIIAGFREQLRSEKEEMWSIRTRIIDFKKQVFEVYRTHIEELQDLSVNEIEDIVLPNEKEIVGRIFTGVRETIQQEVIEEKQRRASEDLNGDSDVPLNSGDISVETGFEKKSEKQFEKEDKKATADPSDDFITLLESTVAGDDNSVTKPFTLFADEAPAVPVSAVFEDEADTETE